MMRRTVPGDIADVADPSARSPIRRIDLPVEGWSRPASLYRRDRGRRRSLVRERCVLVRGRGGDRGSCTRHPGPGGRLSRPHVPRRHARPALSARALRRPTCPRPCDIAPGPARARDRRPRPSAATSTRWPSRPSVAAGLARREGRAGDPAVDHTRTPATRAPRWLGSPAFAPPTSRPAPASRRSSRCVAIPVSGCSASPRSTRRRSTCSGPCPSSWPWVGSPVRGRAPIPGPLRAASRGPAPAGVGGRDLRLTSPAWATHTPRVSQHCDPGWPGDIARVTAR